MFQVNSSSSFFHKIIDYAGFFPPSQLPIEEAFKNFLAYQNQINHEMLYRFICPIAHLQTIYDLSMKQDVFNIPIIVVGSSQEIENQMHWMSMHRDRLSFSSAETKFDYHHKTLKSVLKLINNDINLDMVFLEPNIEFIDSKLISFLDDLSKHSSFGLKVRCGGALAQSIPSIQLLSNLFILCADRNISLKFTAGLHHALRHINHNNTMEHGFINMFLSSMLAFSGQKDKDLISKILDCQDKQKFIFTDEGIKFENVQISTKKIIKARKQVISFGSCDFIQPINDLKDMEIIL